MPLTTPTSIASITQSHRRITLDGGSSKGSTSEWDCRIRHCHSNDLSLLLQVSSIRPSASRFAISARLRRDTTAASELDPGRHTLSPSHPLRISPLVCISPHCLRKAYRLVSRSPGRPCAFGLFHFLMLRDATGQKRQATQKTGGKAPDLRFDFPPRDQRTWGGMDRRNY